MSATPSQTTSATAMLTPAMPIHVGSRTWANASTPRIRVLAAARSAISIGRRRSAAWVAGQFGIGDGLEAGRDPGYLELVVGVGFVVGSVDEATGELFDRRLGLGALVELGHDGDVPPSKVAAVVPEAAGAGQCLRECLELSSLDRANSLGDPLTAGGSGEPAGASPGAKPAGIPLLLRLHDAFPSCWRLRGFPDSVCSTQSAGEHRQRGSSCGPRAGGRALPVSEFPDVDGAGGLDGAT